VVAATASRDLTPGEHDARREQPSAAAKRRRVIARAAQRRKKVEPKRLDLLSEASQVV